MTSVTETIKECINKEQKREERLAAFGKKCLENPEILKGIAERHEKSLARYYARQEEYKKQKEERKKFNERVRQDGIKMLGARVRNNEGRIAYKVDKSGDTPTVNVAYAFCSPSDKFSRRTATELVYMRISGQDDGRHSFSFQVTEEIANNPMALEHCVLGFMHSRAKDGTGMPQRVNVD